MNRIHRVVFNQSLNSWQAVSETARGHTRGGRKARAARLLGAAALGLVAWSVQAADGGAGGNPYPTGTPTNPGYQLHAGNGGATGQGGLGGTNDSVVDSGGGSGGRVAILGRADAGRTVELVAQRYTAATGQPAFVFRGSSPGAYGIPVAEVII